MPDLIGFIVGGGSTIILGLLYKYADYLEDGNIEKYVDESDTSD